jgi:3-hydroxybutyryl-CoA dehydrogenase
MNRPVLYPPVTERLGIAGAGTIACGLAATASAGFDVLLWARSVQSAERARASVAKAAAKFEGGDAARIEVVTDLGRLHDATFLVEAIIEHHGRKAEMLADLGEMARAADHDAVVATTTSSLSVAELSQASGRPESFVALHVFNPVPRMQLVELSFPPQASPDTRARARSLCEALGKTPVEVPDIPGFVVNRLLFPYLFSAAALLAETGMAPEDIDSCMTLGASLPMGPIALLDFVGLDVAEAIGNAIDLPVPDNLRALVRDGSLGRKTGRGFYAY